MTDNYWFNRVVIPDDFLRQTIEVRDERLPVPEADILASPLMCLKFNETWASHIIGAVNALQTYAAWIGDDDDSNTGTRQITKLLASDMTDCSGTGGDCTIEELLADDDFYNDEYLPSVFGEFYSETVANEAAQAIAYDSTPQSIGADIPTGAPNAIEKNALCGAVNRFVALYASTKLCLIQSKNFIEIFWTKLAGAANAMYDTASNLMSPIYSPNIFSCFVSDAAAMTALQNGAAIEELVCHIYEYLNLLSMSQSNFDDAISDAATSLSGDAADIACLMLNDNNLSLYINMLESYQVQLVKSQNGDDVECPCVSDDYWLWLFDFSTGKHGWYAAPSGSAIIGLYDGTQFFSKDPSASVFLWKNFETDYVIRACGVEYSCAGLTGVAGDSMNCSGYINPVPSGTARFTGSTTGLNVNGPDSKEYRDLLEPNSSHSYVVNLANTGTYSGSNYSSIQRIVLYGLPHLITGEKPPGSVWVSGVPALPASLFP